MYHNLYFWLGEVGLILQIISSAVLLHRFRAEKWTVILPFYFVLIMALTLLVRPAVVNLNQSIPAALYLLAVGIIFASRAFVWRSMSLLKDKQMMDKIWQWLTVVGIMFLVLLGWRIRNK